MKLEKAKITLLFQKEIHELPAISSRGPSYLEFPHQ